MDERALSPLRDLTERLERVRGREVALLPQLDLRVDPSATTLRLPTEPNTWLADGERELLWLGPDEWLVTGESDASIADALAGIHHSLVDVSANRAVFDLLGADRSELLAAGCGLDLHPRSWPHGRCAQTLLGRIPVLLQERTEATRVFVRSSFAGSLLGWLSAVSRR